MEKNLSAYICYVTLHFVARILLVVSKIEWHIWEKASRKWFGGNPCPMSRDRDQPGKERHSPFSQTFPVWTHRFGMLGQDCGFITEQFLLLWVLWLFLIELHVKTNTSLQGFSFSYTVHDADIGEKKLENRAIRRQLSDNSISPKQELYLSSKFFKGSYNNLGWKEFRPSRWSSKSRASSLSHSSLMKLLKAVSKKVSSMYKDGNSPTLLDKYCSVSHPHCAEIFSFRLSGRFSISVLKVKKC